ncbi:16S rRNA (guanine(527)-N(7))-methyltransferase RsmG [Lysobacter sp. GX 14042]|uniref:16S rRNA (guanine(527)-N(7))-methyltransferase RsmG n=1 Tax=Lysobacter sp. GX 14042 TaxID=2907155 RepID=UPI001F1574EB|nr:16S rRNA (guanine(527)-N(7))-methyltransferase RsmG [Lysobacter sp. GX 14042]MCE7032190.1 16S rRNA (guanine(527)-N(7))-methyltransferase RsmG [Lysobacter sp. GX 14042]
MNDGLLPPSAADRLAAGLDALAVVPAAHAPLLDYLALLARWNRTYNLTAVRDPLEMVDRHLIDSLAMRPFATPLAATGGRLADLGTGPGLPGIPLAIACPGLRVTLVESNGKKARFLREVVRRLDLGHVDVAETRIEALDRPGAYAAITARALATIPLILQLGGHLLAPGGRLLAMKGVHPAEELAALPPGWRLLGSHRLQVPGLDAERHLVEVGRAGPG